MGREKRRTPRFALRVPLRIEWQNETRLVTQMVMTECIGIHGARLRLLGTEGPTRKLIVTNPANQRRCSAHVVGSHLKSSDVFILQIEFDTPDAAFWVEGPISARKRAFKVPS